MVLLFDCKPDDYDAGCPNSRNRDTNGDRYNPAVLLSSGGSSFGFHGGFRGGIWVPSRDRFRVRRIEE
jgi:hypothetical protein